MYIRYNQWLVGFVVYQQLYKVVHKKERVRRRRVSNRWSGWLVIGRFGFPIETLKPWASYEIENQLKGHQLHYHMNKGPHIIIYKYINWALLVPLKSNIHTAFEIASILSQGKKGLVIYSCFVVCMKRRVISTSIIYTAIIINFISCADMADFPKPIPKYCIGIHTKS